MLVVFIKVAILLHVPPLKWACQLSKLHQEPFVSNDKENMFPRGT